MTAGQARPLVMDASAALTCLQGEPGADRVARLVKVRRPLVPWLFWFEIVNVLGRRRRWPAARISEALYALEQLGLQTRAPDRPSLLHVVDAVEVHGLSAYDAAYFVLAELEDAELLTGDAELAAAAGPRAIPVVAPRRLAEAAARYETYRSQRPVERETWPGAAAYLQQLRRQVMHERRVVSRLE
jgi:predicted nucleic acid-binding protein